MLMEAGDTPVLEVGPEGHERQTCLGVAHSILGAQNMPPGLLCMERIVECVYNPNNGRFRVLQPPHVRECDATFGGHHVRLLREISGRLVQDAIHELKGVKVKAAFFWINIWEIAAEAPPGSLIHFRAGPFHASMPAQELWEYKFWANAFHSRSAAQQPLGAGAASSTKDAAAAPAACSPCPDSASKVHPITASELRQDVGSAESGACVEEEEGVASSTAEHKAPAEPIVMALQLQHSPALAGAAQV